MNVETRSFNLILPSSSSFMTLVVVAITFVSDAMSKTVSSVMGSSDGSSARWPIAFSYKTLSPRPISTTAPGNFLSAMSCSMRGAMRSKRDASTSGD